MGIYVTCAVLGFVLSAALGSFLGWFAFGVSDFGEEGILEPIAAILLFSLAIVPSYATSVGYVSFFKRQALPLVDNWARGIRGAVFGITFIWVAKFYVAVFSGFVTKDSVSLLWAFRIGMLLSVILIPAILAVLIDKIRKL